MALAGIAVAPAITIPDEVDEIEAVIREVNRQSSVGWAFNRIYFKVSKELLEDKEEFDTELDLILKDFNVMKENIQKIEIDRGEDDFMLDMYTVKIKLNAN